MPNLPTKQSNFTRIRNNILNRALENNFTRKIIANFLPARYGGDLIKFVLRDDTPDFEKFSELVKSMNVRTLDSNLRTIIDTIQADNQDEKINKLLDSVSQEQKEFITIKLINSYPELFAGYKTVSNMTFETLAYNIDCKSKKQEELDNIIKKCTEEDIRIKPIGCYLFEKLSIEQRKRYFENFVDILSSDYLLTSYEDELIETFNQFSDEEKAEKYNTILEKYSNAKYSKTNIHNLVVIFKALPEEIKEKNLKNTLDLIKLNNEHSKGYDLSRIIGNLSIDDQKKYYKEALSNLDNLDKIKYFIESIDNSLQEDVIYDLFNSFFKTKDLTSNGFIVKEDFPNIMEMFEPEIRNKVFVNILTQGDEIITNNLSILLESTELRNSLKEYAEKNNLSTISKEKLQSLEKKRYNVESLALLYTEIECDKIVSEFLQDKSDEAYINSLESVEDLFKSKNTIETKLNTYLLMYSHLDEKSKGKFFEETFRKIVNYSQYDNVNIQSTVRTLYRMLNKENMHKILENTNMSNDNFNLLFDNIDDDDKIDFFNNIVSINSPKSINYVAGLLEKKSIANIIELLKLQATLKDDVIEKILLEKNDLTVKTLLFNKEVDKEKIIDLASYDQLQNTSINIDSVVSRLYLDNKNEGMQEFNEKIGEIYNLFTYNNVPEFVKNFRLFQLGKYYEKESNSLESFKDKSIAERDILILEDLFKISLDSNNESLIEFANILIEGKKITTAIQSNPEEKIEKLPKEELAVLEQYRDTLIDLHNITRDVKHTNRPRLEKNDDIIKDFRTLISTYSDNLEHNKNSKNVVFNPNKIMDELFEGFTTTSIRPKAILEYMEQRKESSDKHHLEVEAQLKDGTMHLQPGDFIKGIEDFDAYFPSMLRDGIKGGEYNQEYSHSDFTPLDADFGYIIKQHLDKENMTDGEIISKTISRIYGQNYVVLKQYESRLQNRNKEKFDNGTFKGSSDYYSMDLESTGGSSMYVRTGVPITDIDYIVSKEWNNKNGYEMAMAGIYIPVINSQGELIFSSDDYNKIREQMRGLSTYGAENLIVSEKARDMDALYSVYKSVSPKSSSEIAEEIEQVKSLIEGKEDTTTIQKKQATTRFIKNFFKKHAIKTTDDLSQNLSTDSIELIDTGSTGRGTNVPGDGDFDFMVRHNMDVKILEELSDEVKKLTDPSSEENFINVGNGSFRAKNVTLPTGETVDIDVTTAKKSLKLSYSSDMCVRERLNNIKENNPDEYNYVQANIIMAKKILKSKGIYKKAGSNGASVHGGFGGIGVENWILQNGGSFEQAIDTYLEAANESESYNDFKIKYPIFDFGFNHREGGIRHDCFSNFLTNDSNKPKLGFEYVKDTLTEIKKEIEQAKEDPNRDTTLVQSISAEGFEEAGRNKSTLRNKFSFSKMRSMVAKFMSTQEIETPKHNLEEKDD